MAADPRRAVAAWLTGDECPAPAGDGTQHLLEGGRLEVVQKQCCDTQVILFVGERAGPVQGIDPHHLHIPAEQAEWLADFRADQVVTINKCNLYVSPRRAQGLREAEHQASIPCA